MNPAFSEKELSGRRSVFFFFFSLPDDWWLGDGVGEVGYWGYNGGDPPSTPHVTGR